MLSIRHDANKSYYLDDNAHRVFFDVSKALNKVWQRGHTCKLRLSSIPGNVLNALSSLLNNKQREIRGV